MTLGNFCPRPNGPFPGRRLSGRLFTSHDRNSAGRCLPDNGGKRGPALENDLDAAATYYDLLQGNASRRADITRVAAPKWRVEGLSLK